MNDDQVTAKICIPKVVLNMCDARKMRSDEFCLYIAVYIHTIVPTQVDKNAR